MKKYVMLFTFTVAIVSWIFVIPCVSDAVGVQAKGYHAQSTYRSDTIDCKGTLQSSRQQIVNFGYSVKPDKIYVHEGDTVKTGQKLLDIDREQTLEAFQSITAMAQQQTAPSQTSEDSSSQSVTTADGNELNSLINQYTAGGITQNQAGSISSDSESASSESDDSSVSSADSESEANAGARTISDVPDACYADIDGVVTQVDATDGSFTQPTSPLLVISDPDSIQVKAQVNENLVKRVKIGDQVSISGAAFDRTYHGKVLTIDPSAQTVITENGSKTVVDVLIDIEDKDDSLKPGLNADVSIVSGDSKTAVQVPYDAVEEDNNNIKYVFIVKNGRALRRNVTTGTEYEDVVEITGGINQGEIVLIDPPARLKTGEKVRLKSITEEDV